MNPCQWLLLVCLAAACAVRAGDQPPAGNAAPPEQRDGRALLPVDTYVDGEGWQSGLGYKEMERYVKRLGVLCSERLPGLVQGIGAGKSGVLLLVTFKAQRSFYMARENTEQFMSAIVGDLERMPEPVAAVVHVKCEKTEIIRAYRSRSSGKTQVDFLL